MSRGADPNLVLEEGATPFHVAAGLEDERLAQRFTVLLLRFGADPNIRWVEVHGALFTIVFSIG